MHVNILTQLTIKKNILDIKLRDRPQAAETNTKLNDHHNQQEAPPSQ
jgi:hypothetical protein